MILRDIVQRMVTFLREDEWDFDEPEFTDLQTGEIKLTALAEAYAEHYIGEEEIPEVVFDAAIIAAEEYMEDFEDEEWEE